MSSISKKVSGKIKDYIEKDNYVKLKKYLSKNDIALDEIITKKGEKMLHIAAKKGSCYCLEFLLENGAKPNLVDRNLNLPIHRALKFVIEDYSRSKEKNLVSLLLTYSSGHLDARNREGISARDLIVKLEKIKSKEDKSYISPFTSSGSFESVEKPEDAEWREKLAGEYEDEYESSFGKFDKYSSLSEPSEETYDTWADRIYAEFSGRRNRGKAYENKDEKTQESQKRTLKPEIDLTEAKRSYDLMKQQRKIKKQKVLCDLIFNTKEPIKLVTMPYKDMTAEDILEIVLEDSKKDPAAIKKRIREELLRWHPDKFKQKFGDRIESEDVDSVFSHVKNVSQILINYGK